MMRGSGRSGALKGRITQEGISEPIGLRKMRR